MTDDWRPETIAVRGGWRCDPGTRAQATPIYQTVAYEFEDAEHAADLFDLRADGHVYTRISNPTTDVLEQRLAQLERGAAALALASGHAAVVCAILTLTRGGGNIVSTPELYGGTYRLFTDTLSEYGIQVRWIPSDRPDRLAQIADERTTLVFAETVGNPRLNVLDVPAWASAAHAQGLPLVVDNTVPTPLLAPVLELGADIAVHSLTKFVGGHGTSLGGALIDAGRFDWAAAPERYPGLTEPDPAFHGRVWADADGASAFAARARNVVSRNLGATLSPMSAFLLLQGLQTLPLRMERHSANALAIAGWLKRHPAVAWVAYPGLADDPRHAVAERVMRRGYGALVTFGVAGGRDTGRQLIDALRVFGHAANIGDARSLAIHNASTTHAQLSADELIAAGVTEDTVRLSVGLEHVDDLLADLDQALRSIAAV